MAESFAALRDQPDGWGAVTAEARRDRPRPEGRPRSDEVEVCCRTCRHWARWREASKGVCTALRADHQPAGGVASVKLIKAMAGYPFRTPSHFFCAYWRLPDDLDDGSYAYPVAIRDEG